jgi:hypothetical protein
MIIRAYELQDDSHKFQESSKSKKQSDAYSLTLFSAPNYCNKFKNKGAIIKVNFMPTLEQLHMH